MKNNLKLSSLKIEMKTCTFSDEINDDFSIELLDLELYYVPKLWGWNFCEKKAKNMHLKIIK